MKKIIIALLLTISILPNLQAQLETSNWAFGIRAGLTWNPPLRPYGVTGITTGATATSLPGMPNSFSHFMETGEGCFTLSDAAGNILFYSDGTKIYNKNNAVMLNGGGMNGSNSSAQSGIIVPYPDSVKQYLAISIGNLFANNLAYSVVDMRLDSDKGGVVLGKKSIPFSGFSGTLGETVTSFLHPNKRDFWIIAPGRGNRVYMNAWRFTPAGPQPPVITAFPSEFSQPAANSSGYLKITPDGKHFVWTTFEDKCAYVGDFDNSTGAFSNIRRIIIKESNVAVFLYGIEYSADQQLVYIASVNKLYVFKANEFFTLADPLAATHKEYTLTGTSPFVQALQLAPDGRIYMPIFNQTSMFVVDNPTDFDNLKIYKTAANFLGASSTGQSGLPSFAGSWFSIEPVDKDFVCAGHFTDYLVSVTTSGTPATDPKYLVWDFEDGTIVNQDITNSSGTAIYKMPHKYAAAKTDGSKWTVTVTPHRADSSALPPTKLTANVIECMIRTNPMKRTNLKNALTPY